MHSSIGILFICVLYCGATDIDLIEDLHNSAESNSYTKPYKQRNGNDAWLLNVTSPTLRSLKLSSNTTQTILRRLSKNTGFSLCLFLNPKQSHASTIFSITNSGGLRIFEIKVFTNKHFIKLFYTPDWSWKGFATEKIQFNFTANSWNSLCFEYASETKTVTLRGDCYHSTSTRLQFALPNQKFKSANFNDFKIWIGQRNYKQGYFGGLIKDFIFSDNPEFSAKYCMLLLSDAGTSPEIVDVLPLNIRLSSVENEFNELRKKLEESLSIIRTLQQCQCFPKCLTIVGTEKFLNETWAENDCEFCSCTVRGKVCQITQCPSLECPKKIKEKGQCCERCAQSCQYQGFSYGHDEQFSKGCLACHCIDGSLSCRKIDAHKECPKLNCHHFQQFKPKGKCCKECRQTSLCKFSSCGKNARCIPTKNDFSCICKNGYQGDPYTMCVNVDECQKKGICAENMDCVNVDGSFVCKCKPGYVKSNSLSSGCIVACSNSTCKNNGTCLASNKCQCKSGWTGDQCDQDIDECAIDLIKCPDLAVCRNVPGSYFCACRSGYATVPSDVWSVEHNYQCDDINECSGVRGVDHHCDGFSKCDNNPNGYSCIPQAPKPFVTDSDCVFETAPAQLTTVPNGNEVIHPNSCTKCKCTNGRLDCQKITCDCSKRPLLSCCLECKQEKCDVIKKSFNACELNQTSCYLQTCPVTKCSKVSIFGQCCAGCETSSITSCIIQYNSQITMANVKSSSLSYDGVNGSLYSNGQFVTVRRYEDGSCIICLRWNHHFCCGKSFKCG